MAKEYGKAATTTCTWGTGRETRQTAMEHIRGQTETGTTASGYPEGGTAEAKTSSQMVTLTSDSIRRACLMDKESTYGRTRVYMMERFRMG